MSPRKATIPIRPRRSALYMPGSNTRAIEKAKTLAADVVIFDLEDAVAPDAKAQAREQVCSTVKAGGYGWRELVIRINALETPGARRTCSCHCRRSRCDPRSKSFFRNARSGRSAPAQARSRGAHQGLGDDRDAARDPAGGIHRECGA